MERVLVECDNVSRDFGADPVHDLRVSLRRCRSVADGMMAMDPDRDWKAMKKAGKKLFQQLGALRDVQIMMEWIEKLELIPAPAPPISSAGGVEDAHMERTLLPVLPQAQENPAASAGAPVAPELASAEQDSPAIGLLRILQGTRDRAEAYGSRSP